TTSAPIARRPSRTTLFPYTTLFRSASCGANKNKKQLECIFMPKELTERDKAYWKTNLRLIVITLCVWATVSYGFGILLRPLFLGIQIGGADMGFWFAQQGAILTFLALIFFYSWRMNALDKEYGLEE